MKIRLHEDLLYVTAWLIYQGQQVMLENVILDTGSTGCVFSADKVDAINLLPEPQDFIHQIRGVGGKEFVFTKIVDSLSLGELQVNDFEIEVGAMKYGLNLDGIIGLDFLLHTQAIIDLSQLTIYPAQ
ncbi:MAG: hypothetical protein HC875_07040 [Anaerolineales bacterium]|nr:hypothetical protein [Anaerolineales bacterium]